MQEHQNGGFLAIAPCGRACLVLTDSQAIFGMEFNNETFVDLAQFFYCAFCLNSRTLMQINCCS